MPGTFKGTRSYVYIMANRWLRAKKIKLIESVNPSWCDISRDWERQFKGPIGA